MGDHLHKAIGWAVPSPEDPLDRGAMLTRIAAGDHPEWLFRKTDPIDGESVLVRPSLEDHARWLRDKAPAVSDEETSDEITYDADLLVQDRNRFLDGCVLHVPQLEGGTLLLIPPTYLQDWHRMDDDPDCAFAEDGPIEDRTTYTRSNPFPFSHLWMDALTGRALAGPAAPRLPHTPMRQHPGSPRPFRGRLFTWSSTWGTSWTRSSSCSLQKIDFVTDDDLVFAHAPISANAYRYSHSRRNPVFEHSADSVQFWLILPRRARVA